MNKEMDEQLDEEMDEETAGRTDGGLKSTLCVFSPQSGSQVSAVGGLGLRGALCAALSLLDPADPGPGPRSSLSCFHGCVNGERSAPPSFSPHKGS